MTRVTYRPVLLTFLEGDPRGVEESPGQDRAQLDLR